MNGPKVAVILVNYNGLVDTEECLESLRQNTYLNTQVIVVDNASTDDLLVALSPKFPTVKFIQSEKNLGFTGGNNLGLRYALELGCEYFFLLNNDTVIDTEAIKELVNYFECNPSVGVAQGKIYFYDMPTLFWNLGADVRFNGAWMRSIAGKIEDIGQYDADQEIDCASGCMLFASRAVLEKIGLLDDRFFFQAEDVDFSLRAKKAGFKVHYVASAKIWHKVGSSGNNRIQGYFTGRNRLLLIRKHAPTIQKPICVVVHLAWSIIIVFNLLLRKRKYGAIQGYWLGIVDGVMNRTGKGRLDMLRSSSLPL